MKTKTDFSTTRKQAEDMGRALVTRLNDRKRGWKFRVWENLGWHYEAIHAKSGISVHPSHENGTWRAMVNPSYAVFYSGHPTFRSPHKAIEHVISTSSQYAEETSKHVAKFRSYLE